MMVEKSLNLRLDELKNKMIAAEALTKTGRANELSFFIFDYHPQDEIIVRKETNKLKELNPNIVEFDLYEMMMKIIKNTGYLDDILRLEKEYDRDLMLAEVLQPILSVEENDNLFMQMFQDNAIDDGTKIVLITGVGKAYPIVRSHTILNNLHSVFRKNPVVMFYPGRYETKKAMTLKLFDRLDDDNYYRAFPLVERKV